MIITLTSPPQQGCPSLKITFDELAKIDMEDVHHLLSHSKVSEDENIL